MNSTECNNLIEWFNSLSEHDSYTDNPGVISHIFVDSKLSRALTDAVNNSINIKNIFEYAHGVKHSMSVYNEFIYVKYLPNSEFRLHTDTPLYVSDELYGKFRLVIYLNDDFGGGETVCYTSPLLTDK